MDGFRSEWRKEKTISKTRMTAPDSGSVVGRGALVLAVPEASAVRLTERDCDARAINVR